MSSPIAYQEIYKAGSEDFIIPSYEAAPFTTIQNRALVTRSMKAIAGVERVMVKGTSLLQNEFGSNGENVYEPISKDLRIRLVGSGFVKQDGANGNMIYSITVGDYVEVVFYGTGFNILCFQNASTGDFRSKVDNGVESANLYTVSSSILHLRNYSENTVKNITSGLSLGWHRIQLRVGAVTANGLTFFGFEILNERTDLAVYAGAGISNGSIQGLSALTTSTFNAGVSGTRGARVVKYTQGGVLSQAVQEVDATSKYLTLADHTNEEVVRRINFREFGANRADDFSTLAGVLTSRAFTLDDGSTTLVAFNVRQNTVVTTVDSVRIENAASNFITLTFEGTGLDIIAVPDAVGTSTNTQLVVDGSSQAFNPVFASAATVKLSICSGLPYGTHSIKITQSAASAFPFGILDFIIYQPKTPSIPVGAFAVAPYNLMANFTTPISASLGVPTGGAIRKSNAREFTYVGTWSSAFDLAFDEFGFSPFTATIASYYEIEFWGTGITYTQVIGGASTVNNTAAIDGSSVFSGFTTAFLQTGSGVSFTAATGILSGTSTTNNRLRVTVSGLTLGRHKLRVTTNTAATNLYNDGVDIITPIHAQESSLKVGSQSIHSVTKFSPEKSIVNTGPDLSKAKAWVFFNATGIIYNSYNVSAILKTATGAYTVYFEKPFKNITYCPQYTASQPEARINNNMFTNSIDLLTLSSAGAAADAGYNFLTIYGELQDE